MGECMKTIILVLIMTICLTGCGLSVKGIGKVDENMGKIVTGFDKNVSLDCRAGLAAGLTIVPYTNAGIRASVTALGSVANKDSADYKKCYGLGAWTSFVIHGVDDVTDKLILEFLKMGVL